MELTTTNGNSLAAYAADLQAKLQFCDMLHKSGVLPQSLKSPQAVLAVIIKGQEFGIPPLQSCEAFDFIQGRAAPRASTLQGLCISAGGRFETVEDTADKVTIKATRPDRDWTETCSYSIEDARAAGLAGKDNWQKWKRDMLYARCVARLCRRGWNDKLSGLISAEELQDGSVSVTVAEELPERTMYTYDLRTLYQTDQKKAEGAEGHLRQKGVKETEPHIWASVARIKSLEEYLLKEGTEYPPKNASISSLNSEAIEGEVVA